MRCRNQGGSDDPTEENEQAAEPQVIQERSEASAPIQSEGAVLHAWGDPALTGNLTRDGARTRRTDKTFTTSAGPVYQVSHWTGWVLAILQVLERIAADLVRAFG
jgi:hypothetical protein